MENLIPSKSSSFNDRNIPSKKENPTSLSKSSSFSVHVDRRPPQRTTSSIEDAWSLRASSEGKETENGDVEGHDQQASFEELSKQIDGFINILPSIEENSNLQEIPQVVMTFAKMVQSEIEKYDSPESTLRFGQDKDEDNMLINAVTRVSKVSNLLNKFSSDEKVQLTLSLTTLIVQRAMTLMEEELRIILENSMSSDKRLETRDSNEPVSEECKHNNCNYPMIDDETISNMRRLAFVMISTGYETECCQVYSILRRNAFKEAMLQQGFEKISMDEVQKMQWEALEGQIVNWIKVVKYVATVLLPGEKKLCDCVFRDEHSSISEAMFSNLARSAVILFVNFAEAICMTKRSAERLFKVLDIYDTVTELIVALEKLCSKDCAKELRCELCCVRRRLGEAAVSIFCDLENCIKYDIGKSPVPGGAVHPLTRYTMNYLWYACDFKETLEQVFSVHDKNEEDLEAFAAELMKIMRLLDENLESKSKLYKDPSLRYIFLMNNGRYIMQKMKECTEIHNLVGNDYCRKRSSELRGYHKSYQRETWSRVLQCLNQEGLQVNGKVQKTVLKERFKNFNQMLEEIHKTQSSWVVSDEQLQSELRVSVSAVMIPAYRSFLSRFGQHFSPGRQHEKYIKYQPDDIETTIETLFDGNQNLSMSKKKF